MIERQWDHSPRIGDVAHPQMRVLGAPGERFYIDQLPHVELDVRSNLMDFMTRHVPPDDEGERYAFWGHGIRYDQEHGFVVDGEFPRTNVHMKVFNVEGSEIPGISLLTNELVMSNDTETLSVVATGYDLMPGGQVNFETAVVTLGAGSGASPNALEKNPMIEDEHNDPLQAIKIRALVLIEQGPLVQTLGVVSQHYIESNVEEDHNFYLLVHDDRIKEPGIEGALFALGVLDQFGGHRPRWANGNWLDDGLTGV